MYLSAFCTLHTYCCWVVQYCELADIRVIGRTVLLFPHTTMAL